MAGRSAREVKLKFLRQLWTDSGIFEKAPGMIISITGGSDIKLSEVQQIAEAIAPKGEECRVKIGLATDPAFAGRISAIVLAAEA